MQIAKTVVGMTLCLGAYAGIAVLARGEGESGIPADAAAEADALTSEEGAIDGAAETDASEPSLLEALTSGLSEAGVRARVEGLFTPEAVYQDPFGRFEGREQIVQHFEKLFAGMEQFDLTIKEEFVSGEDTVSVWSLVMKHKSLSSDPAIELEGITHIRSVGGKVIARVDYYDLGRVVYERLPILGSVVRWVKGKGM